MLGESLKAGWIWLKGKVKQLKLSLVALYYAAHDPQTGWLPMVIACVALAYALSPLDLIPDFIPVLGVLDDLLILPGLVWLAIKLIPKQVWADAQERAEAEPLRLNENWIAAVCIFVVWDALALCSTYALSNHFCNAFLRGHLWIPLVAVGAALILSEGMWIVWTLWKVAKEREQPVDVDEEGPGAGGPEEPLITEGQ